MRNHRHDGTTQAKTVNENHTSVNRIKALITIEALIALRVVVEATKSTGGEVTPSPPLLILLCLRVCQGATKRGDVRQREKRAIVSEVRLRKSGRVNREEIGEAVGVLLVGFLLGRRKCTTKFNHWGKNQDVY